MTYIKILYYYEIPTLIFCQDIDCNNYIFGILDDEKYEYVGKKINLHDAILFLNGEIELRPIFEKKPDSFYLGKYNKNEFQIVSHETLSKEDYLPERELFLLTPELDLVEKLKQKLN